MRGENPKRTIAKIDKIELGIDSYGKNIDTSIGVVRIDHNVLFSGQIYDSKRLGNPKRIFSIHKNDI